MIAPWTDVDDAEGAFPSDWRAQCDIAEEAAIDGWPASSHDGLREKATIPLWLGVMERAEIPETRTIKITARRSIKCDTAFSDGGSYATRSDGTEVPALDVYVIVKCSQLRKMIGSAR